VIRHEQLTAVQLWGAVFLTVGEFGIAIWMVVHDGHLLALYLATTYAIRETSGGHHYHDVIIRAWKKLRLPTIVHAPPSPEKGQE
jgi:hypothetical protein